SWKISSRLASRLELGSFPAL
ncbi:hypothetical protein Zm00014a_018831, partial [Zea mays]